MRGRKRHRKKAWKKSQHFHRIMAVSMDHVLFFSYITTGHTDAEG